MIAILLLGCGGSPAPDGVLTLDDAGSAPLVSETAQAGRSYRRMNIDQLAASIERATGKRWEEVSGDETQLLFERLSGSLGKPEFLDSTEEDLVPGLLFQKFLDDAAKAVCRSRIAEDLTLSDGSRVFVTHTDPARPPFEDPEGVRRTLQRNLLVFHGRDVPLDDPGLDRWEWLVNTAYERTAIPTNGWRTACVAFLTHPDFYTY